MGFRAVRSWTLGGLILAFVDLAIAYTLLCGSAFAFVPSKLLSFFGLYVPCPCSGFFGYQNDDLCLHRLVVDWPIRKINDVRELAKDRFPFDLIWFDHKSCNFHVEGRKCGFGVSELEGEACSSSLSGPQLQSSVDRESGFDAKGKKIVNQKHKSVIRRRRRGALGYGKISPALSSNSTHSVSVGVPLPSYDGICMRSEINESLDLGSGIEDGHLGDQNVPKGLDFSERIRHSFELDGTYGESKDINRYQLSLEKFTRNAGDRLRGVGNDISVIQVLQQALEEQKAAHAVLYQELEKERAAAATAADEAMAMILRLQEDKALIEMEARQYHRVIEEKFAYDEEEMEILKEIIVRREKEIHFLEKEVQAYEQMNFLRDEQVEVDSSYMIDDKEQRNSLSTNKFIGEKEVAVNAKWLSNYEHNHTLALGKEMMSKHKELTSDLSTSQGLVHKTVSEPGKEKTERDIGMISPEREAPQTCCSLGEKVEEDGRHWNEASSMRETESTVYDVHVIDDKTELYKENGGKESGPANTAASYSGVQSSQFLSDCPTVSAVEIDPQVHGSSLDVHGKLLVSGPSPCKTFTIDSWRKSPSPADAERLKIDNEVEWLRERLRLVQEEKEKLTFSAEHGERVNTQLKLVEDILNQLREIQQLRDPVRHASLPPSSSKVNLKKRHSRSVSGEDFNSA